MPSDFVTESPHGLSRRAGEFLAQHASRVEVDLGPTGDALRAAMQTVHGRVDEVLIQTLERVQRRYGGLSYSSGFFDAVVTFAPSCEPDPDEEEFEILYAVETGSVSGASLTRLGEVEVGIDEAGLIEFGSLDTLIESDAMFAAAALRPAHRTVQLDGTLADPAGILDIVDSVRLVDEASGRRTWWLTDGATDIFYCGIWHDLGMVMPPFVKIWTEHPELLHNSTFGRRR